jgi:DNA modification methylase
VQLLPELAAFANKIADRIEMVGVAELKPHPRKTRTHDEKQIAAITGSFTQFGFLNPIVIDESNIVLAGDARLEAARRLGISALPTIRIDYLSESEKRAYKVADNRIAELAEWDLPELSIELTELIDIDFNMDALGFDAPTIDLVLIEAARQADAEPDAGDAIPDERPGPAVSRTGDIWSLGSHRVICGSALDPEVLKALMGERQARLVLTDAPYNVPVRGFVSGLGKVKHREFAMASGEMSKPEFLAFLTEVSVLSASYLVDGGLHYGFMDWRGLGTYMAALDACGLSQLNLCVWNKGTGGMGSLYRSQHELCLIYKKGSVAHVNNVELGQNGRYRTNVWDHPGMASFGRERDEALKLHPTVKPVNLLVEAIRDVSRQKEIILDTFLGTGSTLVAAQKCGRICYGIEIDPLYVDTIVRRFEAVTGIKAVHLQTGMTFAELAGIRGQEAGTEAADAEAGAHADAEVTTRQPPNGSGSCCSSDELPLIRIRQRSRNRITPEVANV